MPDIRVCELANSEQRIMLTNDKDFGEIVFFQRKASYGIVLFRVKGQDCSEKISLLERLIDRHSDKLTGYFVVVTKEKFRFLPLALEVI